LQVPESTDSRAPACGMLRFGEVPRSRGAPPMSHRPLREPEISVVIAVGDHKEAIGHDIRRVAAHLDRLGRAHEIVVVNAGSSDNSLSIARLLAASSPT